MTTSFPATRTQVNTLEQFPVPIIKLKFVLSAAPTKQLKIMHTADARQCLDGR
jgi:hypothetical protein